MGTPPAFNCAIRAASISVHITSWPASARHAPVTSPTYPHPITDKCKFTSLLDLAFGTKKVYRTKERTPKIRLGMCLLCTLPHQKPAQTKQHQPRLTANHVPQESR